MLHDLFNWFQSVPGSTDGDPSTSWAAQLVGSLHLWAVLEATHVLTRMLFAGTIIVVDLRMLGVIFRTVPYSTLNNKVLPLTVAGFALLILTGAILFFAEPLKYYHSVWFRLKMIFLLVAAANIFWFHHRTHKTIAEWDAQESTPTGVKTAAAVSLASWALVIIFGRLIAFTWFNCENLQANTFGYAFAECESQMREAIEAQEAYEEEEATEEEAVEEEAVEGEATDDSAAPEDPPPEEEPSESAPTPAPGDGG